MWQLETNDLLLIIICACSVFNGRYRRMERTGPWYQRDGLKTSVMTTEGTEGWKEQDLGIKEMGSNFCYDYGRYRRMERTGPWYQRDGLKTSVMTTEGTEDGKNRTLVSKRWSQTSVMTTEGTEGWKEQAFVSKRWAQNFCYDYGRYRRMERTGPWYPIMTTEGTEGWKEQDLGIKEMGSKLLFTSQHLFVEAAYGIYHCGASILSKLPTMTPDVIASKNFGVAFMHTPSDRSLIAERLKKIGDLIDSDQKQEKKTYM